MVERSRSREGTARAEVRAMLFRLTIGCITIAAITACADTDPRYGPPGVIGGLQVDFGGDGGASGSGAPRGDAGAQSSQDAQDKFAALFATLGTCSGCHGANQTPVFMKATAEATRVLWKGAGYDKLPTSAVYNKPQHAAPGLTAAQKDLMKLWADAENAGAGAKDAGGGG